MLRRYELCLTLLLCHILYAEVTGSGLEGDLKLKDGAEEEETDEEEEVHGQQGAGGGL